MAMQVSKPFASLSSGLLARKGAAKPAMRPQGFGQGASLEDLGWNDMGSSAAPEFEGAAPEHVPSSIAALTPAPRSPMPVHEEGSYSAPPVVEQQRVIAESYAEEEDAVEEAAPEPRVAASVFELPRRRARPGAAPKAKVAFTLRLDAERHLKLRLASAVLGRSSQMIVTDALDALIATLPEVEALAGQIPAAALKRS
jgi:hypothetical protein